jgi:hypothetical protein
MLTVSMRETINIKRIAAAIGAAGILSLGLA